MIKNGYPTLVDLVEKSKNKKKELVSAGVAILLFKDADNVLLGKRKGSHGSGEWAIPGGRLEPNETPLTCIVRELEEETGIQIEPWNINLCIELPFYNTITGGQPWLTIYYAAHYNGQEPKVMEPDKCEEWRWCKLNNLPKPLFKASAVILEAIK
jgi:8-oxo-dGTP diphosphatase